MLKNCPLMHSLSLCSLWSARAGNLVRLPGHCYVRGLPGGARSVCRIHIFILIKVCAVAHMNKAENQKKAQLGKRLEQT
ncbi:hypothetical protein C8Q74DRAFT_353216 [Fomes fomentarius]|nr:hypothetical protein C8Q74DRAFT_353216 [Fomes fomentarius]